MTNLVIAAATMEHELAAWVPQQPGESRLTYGERVVLFLLRTQLTAALTDDDLELAKHTINRMRPLCELGSPTDRALTDVDTLCTVILRARRVETLLNPTAVPAAAPDRPNEGPMAPLTPVPFTRPPAPVSVDFSF